jgi:hypothetical protein
VPLAPSLLPRWLAFLQRGMESWRELSRRRAEQRALDQLNDGTRRDIGLAEREPPMRDRSLWDLERGLW